MKHLYFTRHGQSVANLDQTYAGQLNTPLTEYGREQAKIAGLEAHLLGIDQIVASPLSRALETAQIIAREIGYPEADIVTNDLFMERHLGSLQGKPWSIGPEDETLFPNIETLEHLGARAQRALNFLQKLEAPNVLVVGHGSFALALCDILGFDTGGEELPNTKIVQLL